MRNTHFVRDCTHKYKAYITEQNTKQCCAYIRAEHNKSIKIHSNKTNYNSKDSSEDRLQSYAYLFRYISKMSCCKTQSNAIYYIILGQ